MKYIAHQQFSDNNIVVLESVILINGRNYLRLNRFDISFFTCNNFREVNFIYFSWEDFQT